VATTILPVAYGIILIMISYRYLPIFPQEAELNPIEEEAAGSSGSRDESTPVWNRLKHSRLRRRKYVSFQF
jgi:hypothetical protein